MAPIPRNAIRAQNPFELPEFKGTAALQTSKPETTIPSTDENPFEIPPGRVTVTSGVIPPSDPETSDIAQPAKAKSPAAEGESEALKRLKERSAKARWEQMHQEWLKNRKVGEPSATPAISRTSPAPIKPAPPAAEQSGETHASENPFESLSPTKSGAAQPADNPGETPKLIDSDTPPVVPLVEQPAGKGVLQPSVNPLRAVLQSQVQEKPPVKKGLPTDEELRQQLIEGESQPLAPAVRDPADLPKITEIVPNPVDRAPTPGRAVPEHDFKRYVKLGNLPYEPRSYPEFTYQYQATNVWSNPLYFEDPLLERYGHANHPVLQPFASVGLFVLQLGGLPYQMAINHPSEKVYPLGWYSPGDYVPYRMRQIPLSLKGAIYEAAVIGGVRAITP